MIPFLDLKALNARYDKAFKAKFADFLASGWYILGKEVTAFEQEFAAFCQAEYAVGVANGLDAIRLLFEAYKIQGKLQDGDEVLVPANTYIASVLAISQAGLRPVFVDVDYDTMNIAVEKIEAAITPKTKAILVVHLYGQLVAMDAVLPLAKKHKLLVVEDAAQAHGAKSNNYQTGSCADAAAFSFYPTKNLGALADGGIITSNDKDLITLLKILRNYGQEEKYIAKYQGFNSRLDEVQAALLRIKLPYLNTDNAKRLALAKRYSKGITNTLITTPTFATDGSHIFHQYVVRSKHRNALQDYLLKNDIETIVHYPVPPHKQEAYKKYNTLSFPVAEQLAQEVLSLPISPLLTEEEQNHIITVLNNFKC